MCLHANFCSSINDSLLFYFSCIFIFSIKISFIDYLCLIWPLPSSTGMIRVLILIKY
uniref:Uncharacterized protein n=1 Tax=Anguilla anguilla TaxID=7936 RepID=A0A0E9XV75_ANGAN